MVNVIMHAYYTFDPLVLATVCTGTFVFHCLQINALHAKAEEAF